MPDSVSPLMPTRPTLATLACSVAQLRAGVAVDDCSASAKSAPVSSRPRRSAELPLLPAKPLMPLPPMASRRVVTVEPSASLTDESLLSSAKLPLSCTKPKASSDSTPLAFSTRPSAPLMSSVSVLPGAVATTRFCAA